MSMDFAIRPESAVAVDDDDDASLMRKTGKKHEGRRKRIVDTMAAKARSANPEAQQQSHQVNPTGKPSFK